MLGKLLKYDLKWIYKVIVVFYILALFLPFPETYVLSSIMSVPICVPYTNSV